MFDFLDKNPDATIKAASEKAGIKYSNAKVLCRNHKLEKKKKPKPKPQ